MFQGNSAFQIHQNWCTFEPTETVTACTYPAQVQARWGPTLRGASKHRVLPLIKKLFAIYTSQQEKYIHFLQQSVTDYVNHNPGPTPCPGVVSEYKIKPWSFVGAGRFVSFCFDIFYLIDCFLFVCFIGLVLLNVHLLWEREMRGQNEREDVMLSWQGSLEDLGRVKVGENSIKCMKIKFKKEKPILDTDLNVWFLRDWLSKGIWRR